MFGENGELTPAQVAEVTGRLPGVTEELESRGMNPSNGKFQKGNKFGRPRVDGCVFSFRIRASSMNQI